MSNNKVNPYTPLHEIPKRTKLRWFMLSILPVIGFSYPLLATGSVALTWFMGRVLGLRGAILDSYDTPMGVVFNITVWLIMYCWLWGPFGLFLSSLLGVSCGRPQLTILIVLAYLALCFLSILFAIIDPFGLYDYFFD